MPKECNPNGKSPLKYEVGRCKQNACTKRPKANPECEYCCGPTKQTTKTVTCGGYSMDIIVILECGCTICNQVNISGNVITIRREVTLRGVAHDINDPSNALRFGKVYLFDEQVGITSFNGDFSFSVPNGMTRLVVTLKENVFKVGFIEASKVFTIPKDFSGTLFKKFPLLMKSKAIEIPSSVMNTIPLAQSSDGSLAEVVIPDNAFYKPDGSQHNGVVKAAINFISPQDIVSVDTMVGDLTFVDNNGDVGSLETFGMFHMEFNDASGKELNIKGDVNMAIRADVIGKELESSTTVKLWSLNPSSARWEYESTLERISSSRRKRSQSQNTTDFFVGDTVITDRYWFNFDDDSLNFCFVKIKAYADSNLREPLEWLNTFEPSVISKDVLPSGPGMIDGRVLTGSRSHNRELGSKDDCILTVCRPSNFHAYLFFEDQNGAFSASPRLGGSNQNVPGVTVNVKQLTDTITSTRSRVIETEVEPLRSNGPLYHSDTVFDCVDPSSASCTSCTDTNIGPECNKCSRFCLYSHFAAYTKCLSASDTDPHYAFYQNEISLFEYSVCENAVSCEENLHLAWFPLTSEMYRAWYIKVQVVPVSSVNEYTVRVVSKGGTHQDTKGGVFGIREDVTSSQSVCIEFKGSGNIIALSGVSEPDETVIEIYVQGTGCRVKTIADDLEQYEITPVPSNNNQTPPLISFQTPLAFGNKFGLYEAEDVDMKTAKSIAKWRCECSKHSIKKKCVTPDSKGGEAVGIECFS
ncbi:unnamed protein product [Owenia fusiformis]|uniref:Uncharacterized protein n=1 Tax=Owenia fusiformis TaxID=6347 RepID=A0A8S4Q519_OWEFU|nr:unnamed protein product [Owenia fusiformis]